MNSGNVPPNQRVTDKFPVLSIGSTPRVDPSTYSLRIWGNVQNELTFTLSDLQNLGIEKRREDFHCVTGWSRLNDEWEGVPLRKVMNMVKPTGKFVMFHSADGYTTNVPLEYALREASMLALRFNGSPIPPEHGGPVRVFIPYLYAWKSAKWVTGIEVMEDNIPGFWEQRGYHMIGDPWKEQRYGERYDFLEILNIRKRRSK